MVQYITIGGAERPIKFGMNAFRRAKINFAELTSFDQISFDKLFEVIMNAFRIGHKIEGRPLNFTKDDLGDWIDEDYDHLAKLVELMVESIPQKSAPKNQNPPQN